MRVSWHNFLDWNKNLFCVAYRYKDGNPWHIYSSYDILETKPQDVVLEVMRELKIARRNIRIIRPNYIQCDVIE